MSFVGGSWRSGSPADVATGSNSTATVSGITPTTFVQGNSITLTVTGTGFTANTIIHANYAPVATIFDSATQLRCVGFNTTPDSGGAGVIPIGVVKPGEKMSGTQNFTATASGASDPTEILRDGLEDFSKGTVSGTPTIVAARTNNGMQVNSLGDGIGYTIPSAQESDTVTVGCAFRFAAAQSGACLFRLNSDAGVTNHISAFWAGSGSGMWIQRGSSPIAFGSVPINAATWYYIEIQCKLHDSTGTITTRINGVTDIALTTGLDTKNGGTKTVFDTIKLSGIAGTSTIFDDVYVKAGAASTFNGPIAV